MARRIGRGAWAIVELDSGELARRPGGEAWLLTTREAAERMAIRLFGTEAGREWGVGHLSGRELAAAERIGQ